MLNDLKLGAQSYWGLLDQNSRQLMKVEPMCGYDRDQGYQLVKPCCAEEEAAVYLVTDQCNVLLTLMQQSSPERSSRQVPLYQPHRPMWNGIDLVPVKVTFSVVVDMQPQLRPLQLRHVERRPVPYLVARRYVPEIEPRERYTLLIVEGDLLQQSVSYGLDQHQVPYRILGRAPAPDEYADRVKGKGTLLLVEEGYPI